MSSEYLFRDVMSNLHVQLVMFSVNTGMQQCSSVQLSLHIAVLIRLLTALRLGSKGTLRMDHSTRGLTL